MKKIYDLQNKELINKHLIYLYNDYHSISESDNEKILLNSGFDIYLRPIIFKSMDDYDSGVLEKLMGMNTTRHIRSFNWIYFNAKS